MGAIAAILICAGIIGLIVGIFQKVKAGRVTDAPLATTGDVVQKGPAVVGVASDPLLTRPVVVGAVGIVLQADLQDARVDVDGIDVGGPMDPGDRDV